MMLDETLPGKSPSHFQNTRCGSWDMTRMNVSTNSFGIDETETNEPSVKMMNPSLASSAKVLSFCVMLKK